MASPTPVVVRSDFAVVQIARAAEASQYVVDVGDRVVRTNDVAVIVAALPAASRQYIDVSQLSQKQRAVFSSSVQTVLDAQHAGRVRVVETAAPLVSTDGVRSGLVVRDTIRETSTNSGRYAQRADATVDGSRFSFR